MFICLLKVDNSKEVSVYEHAGREKESPHIASENLSRYSFKRKI